MSSFFKHVGQILEGRRSPSDFVAQGTSAHRIASQMGGDNRLNADMLRPGGGKNIPKDIRHNLFGGDDPRLKQENMSGENGNHQVPGAFQSLRHHPWDVIGTALSIYGAASGISSLFSDGMSATDLANADTAEFEPPAGSPNSGITPYDAASAASAAGDAYNLANGADAGSGLADAGNLANAGDAGNLGMDFTNLGDLASGDFPASFSNATAFADTGMPSMGGDFDMFSGQGWDSGDLGSSMSSPDKGPWYSLKNLSSDLSLAGGIYGMYSGVQHQREARQQRHRQADYENQLHNLINNPGSITSDPGYQFGLEQGEQGLLRTSASRGMTGSGGEAAALKNFDQLYAGQRLGQKENFLAQQKGQPLPYNAGFDLLGGGLNNTTRMLQLLQGY